MFWSKWVLGLALLQFMWWARSPVQEAAGYTEVAWKILEHCLLWAIGSPEERPAEQGQRWEGFAAGVLVAALCVVSFLLGRLSTRACRSAHIVVEVRQTTSVSNISTAVSSTPSVEKEAAIGDGAQSIGAISPSPKVRRRKNADSQLPGLADSIAGR